MSAAPPFDAADRSRLLEQAAHMLVEAERERRPIACLTRTVPDLNVAEAYDIAAIRVAALGGIMIGYKLGYTSAAMRAQMGIAEPNYGVLLEGSVIGSGETVPMEQLIHPRVEPEVTFLIGQDLAGPGIDREGAWEAVEAAIASIEIVDTRYPDYAFTAPDNIADNSSAARLVLGDQVARNEAGDLCGMIVRLEQDGVEIDQGRGQDAMGDPVLALAWLANKLSQTGDTIPAGALVMTGGLTRAYPASAGARFSASFDGIGAVDAQF